MSGPLGNDPDIYDQAYARRSNGGEFAGRNRRRWAHHQSQVVTELVEMRPASQAWAAATYSAQNAARYQLDSGRPVIPLGGWLGTRPRPNLEQFMPLVTEHRIGYFIWTARFDWREGN